VYIFIVVSVTGDQFDVVVTALVTSAKLSYIEPG